MGRRPVEDDREQVDRGPRQRAAGRGPADQRRHRAGGAADHDVLWGAALQPDRVHADVADEPAQRQRGGQQVHGQRQQHERQRAQSTNPNDQRGAGRDPARRDRPRGGAAHLGVDVAVVVVVDRAGAARRQIAAQARQRDQRDRRVAGDLHRGDRREQQQRLDLRLGQLEVVGQQLPRTRGGRRRAEPALPTRRPCQEPTPWRTARCRPSSGARRSTARSGGGCRASARPTARGGSRRSC